ncbi:plasmid mobilization relaxosome protein MobC [filamentous cyanobacterium LEGE 11480]|uniref:Plasmid mobilization relaxosome protein MobC n=1 Tax=Romeriopsis navalis LEGE 11480 TaxID=2777977 RepID=A0A928Z2K1_9CYAN|nr:hypothetical protein [Romeriopsis navalis]MBE9030466.1 plasmid mobilization relaxosome protein MobC [Romeriopsis navalis LEGE 11480]
MSLVDRLAQQLDALSGDRTEKVTVRLTRAERKQLEQRCGGIRLSTYIRAGLFDYPMPKPRVTVPPINRQVYVELNRIGVNLNQQTKLINALRVDEMPGAVKEYAATLAELQQQIQVVKQAVILGVEELHAEGTEETPD